MRTKHIIGAVIIVVFVIWGASSFLSTTIRYVSIDDVAQTRGTIQVIGEIDFSTVQYESDSSRLIFEITDPDNRPGSKRLRIVYSGMVPGNFEQATSVVARGQYRDNLFVADQLLVKCPSKYQGEDGEA